MAADDNPRLGPRAPPLSGDDGYVSPDFDLPSSDDDPDAPPPSKRSKFSKGSRASLTVDDDEALALRLLHNHSLRA